MSTAQPSASTLRTAVLLSGHVRTFDRCYPTLRHHVLRHFPGADVFVSTVKNADSPKLAVLEDGPGLGRVCVDLHDTQPVLPLPPGCPPEESWQPGVPFMHEPYAISVSPQAILRQLWQLNECWCLFTREANPADYDVILRVRFDSYFHSFAHEYTNRHLERITLPAFADFVPPAPKAWTPWWGRFGGLNDRFAVLSPVAARAYFTTYAQLPALIASGCPLHPESLIAAALHAAGVDHRPTLRAEFSTLKNTADGLQCRPPEISLIDLAHATLPA